MFMHNALLTARSGFLFGIVPLAIAMLLAPGMRSALSISAMSDGSAFCVGISCQANRLAEGPHLDQLIRNSIPAHIAASLSKITATTSSAELAMVSATAHWAAELCARCRVLLCGLAQGILQLGTLLLTGLSGASAPTRLDLGLIATFDPHVRPVKGCPDWQNKSSVPLRPRSMAST
jgi:hypothetical protein